MNINIGSRQSGKTTKAIKNASKYPDGCIIWMDATYSSVKKMIIDMFHNDEIERMLDLFTTTLARSTIIRGGLYNRHVFIDDAELILCEAFNLYSDLVTIYMNDPQTNSSGKVTWTIGGKDNV